MVVYRSTSHSTWLRRSRLWAARNNYTNAYNNYKSWQEGYTQARNNRRKYTATNIWANNDRVVKSIWWEVRKAKSNLNSARRTLKTETKRANNYYNRSKSR